jgi:hypothetical protein
MVTGLVTPVYIKQSYSYACMSLVTFVALILFAFYTCMIKARYCIAKTLKSKSIWLGSFV